jgi:hypothetical protein
MSNNFQSNVFMHWWDANIFKKNIKKNQTFRAFF